MVYDSHVSTPINNTCKLQENTKIFSFYVQETIFGDFQTLCLLMPKFDTCQFSCHNCKQVLTADEFSLSYLSLIQEDADTSRKTASLSILKSDSISHCSKSSFFVQKFNFDFPWKLSIFWGWKTLENVVVLDFAYSVPESIKRPKNRVKVCLQFS